MPPVLSIIIVNWNTRDDLVACLGSLQKAELALEHEILVLDNASRDGSVDAVEQLFPSVHLLCAIENLGFARGNNMVLRQAQGVYWLLLNPDTLVESGQIEPLVAYLNEQPNVGIVAPRLVYGDGSFQISTTPFVQPQDVYWEHARFPRFLQPRAQREPRRLYTFPTEEPLAVDTVIGAALLIRREVAEQVGLLDPDYAMYGEEMDWCYRVKQAGYAVHWLPTATITHLGGRAAAQVPYAMLAHRFGSTFRFLAKHHGDAAAWRARGLLVLATLQNLLLSGLRRLAGKLDAKAWAHERRGAGVLLTTACRGAAAPLPSQPTEA